MKLVPGFVLVVVLSTSAHAGGLGARLSWSAAPAPPNERVTVLLDLGVTPFEVPSATLGSMVWCGTLTVTGAQGAVTNVSLSCTVAVIDTSGGVVHLSSETVLDVPPASFPLTLSVNSWPTDWRASEGNRDADSTSRATVPASVLDGGVVRAPRYEGPISFRIPVNQPTHLQLVTQAPATFAFSTASDSGLPFPRPSGTTGCVAGCSTPPPSAMTVSSDGVIDWTPQVRGVFLGALTLGTLDGGLSVPLRLDFRSVDAGGASLSPCGGDFTVFPGVPLEFVVDASTMPLNGPVSVNSSKLPPGATLTGLGTSGSTRQFRFSWPNPPAISPLQVGLEASDQSPGVTCLFTFRPGVAQTEFISGVIRDFATSSPDFNRGNGDTTIRLVAPTLSAADKPMFQPSATPLTVQSSTTFNTWFNGQTNAQVYSIALTNGGSPAPTTFWFRRNPFFPIDDRLLGNEGGWHNSFFTFELHTWVLVAPGMEFEFTSADDLWVFFNGVLAVDLGGVHPATTRSVRLDSLGLSGPVSMALFYAHRGRDHEPVLGITRRIVAADGGVDGGVSDAGAGGGSAGGAAGGGAAAGGSASGGSAAGGSASGGSAAGGSAAGGSASGGSAAGGSASGGSASGGSAAGGSAAGGSASGGSAAGGSAGGGSAGGGSASGGSAGGGSAAGGSAAGGSAAGGSAAGGSAAGGSAAGGSAAGGSAAGGSAAGGSAAGGSAAGGSGTAGGAAAGSGTAGGSAGGAPAAGGNTAGGLAAGGSAGRTPGEPTGCGCASSDGSALFLLAVFARRLRRGHFFVRNPRAVFTPSSQPSDVAS